MQFMTYVVEMMWKMWKCDVEMIYMLIGIMILISLKGWGGFYVEFCGVLGVII